MLRRSMGFLSVVDIVVLGVYTVGVVGFGAYFYRSDRSVAGFTVAGGVLPTWAVGLSLFGTFLSSNTFLGVPGKAYASNWNSFIFSLSLPFAAWIAARYFVPFYRDTGEVSAYSHLERRFGRWARIYATIFYLLTQVARTGAILMGVALALNALTAWRMDVIIITMGLLITFYTLVGGMEAVVWTDVVQSIILTTGTIGVAILLLVDMPGGASELFRLANAEGKMSLGSWDVDFQSSTVLCVFLYGIFINLTNFGIDQNYVQRYHTARTSVDARRSVWFAAVVYIPVSLLFFFIGTGLFATYGVQPELKADLMAQVMATTDTDTVEGSVPDPEQLGDRVFPHYIVHRLPPGVSGLVIAALLAAAMSSVDTSLNSSATVIFSDLYQGWLRPSVSEREGLWVLYAATLLMGCLGTGTAVGMVGVGSLLDTWWMLAGIFSGGMLGLFLLGRVTKSAQRPDAALAVGAGLLVIAWMTLSPQFPEGSMWRNPLHANMTIVVGTLTIFLVGSLLARLRRALR